MADRIEINANDPVVEKYVPRIQTMKEMRREASRLASKANKRIERLERNGFKDSPAYKTYLEGGGKFGVRGKTHNQVQQEVSRLNKFLNSQTSTVKGVIANLKTMAVNTGISYKNLTELKNKAAKFFELAEKVEQYLRSVKDMASAIGYQKIWEAINTYTDEANVDLSSGEADIDSMIESVTAAIELGQAPETLGNGEQWFYLIKD